MKKIRQNKFLAKIRTSIPLGSSLGTRLTLSIGLVITITSFFLFIGIYRLEKQRAIQQIDTQAQALLTEMVVLREWVSQYKGVWTTRPGNYYLDSDGDYYRKTPAMVTKELSDLSDDKGYYRFNITSLNLTNPSNAPDDFEHDALMQFEENKIPVTSFDQVGNDPVYRFTIPLTTDASCLECHQDQGYQVGDVRGGLSVLIPVQEMEQSLANSRQVLTFSAISIVILVMIALYFMVRRMVIAPVGQLKMVAAAVGHGNYDARCGLNTGDELEMLGDTLNQMTANLRTSADSLNRRIEQRTQELNALSDVSLIISRAGALDDILQEALLKVTKVADVEGGIIQHFEGEKTWIAAQSGLPNSILNCFRRLQEKPGYQNNIQKLSSPVQVLDAEATFCNTVFPGYRCKDDLEECNLVSAGYSSFASVVLISRQRSLGVLTLFSNDQSSFTSDFMQLLECIGHQLGVAVENASFHQRTEQMAILEERTRISREMHDSLAQTLGWLRIKTELLEDDLRLGEIERTKEDLTAIRRVVRDACYDVRESIDGLRTRPTGGLTTTAAAWISEFSQRSDLQTEFYAKDGAVPLSAVVEAELLRILQEGLTNVRKHAQAQMVRVDFQIKGSFTELVIEDDGEGFDYQVEQDSGHYGLRIMRERAERLGGTFNIESSPENGTKITALLPLFPASRPQMT